jgi:CheY-like chemotaxis protein
MLSHELPFLRRYARALSGSQAQGDAYVMAALEAVVADASVVENASSVRVGLYKLLDTIWSSSGGQIAEEEERDAVHAASQRQLAPLTPRSRQALLLNSLEGFDLSEIAEAMSCSEDEARVLIEGGRAQIEKQTRGRILIIEDEPIIAMDIQGIVESLGHTVTGVAHIRTDAVSRAMADPPDLVLADIQLADGSSGIDAVNDILAAFSVPVIFITAYPERLLTGERPEPTFLISKPFKDDQVGAAIGQALFFQGAAVPAAQSA